MGALQTNDVDRGSRRRVDIIDVSLGGFRSFSCRMRTVGIRPEMVIAIHQESSSGSCTLGVLAGRQRCDDQVGSGHRNAPNVDGRRARRNSFLAPILVASSRPKLRRICCFSKALSHRVQRSGKIVTSAPTRMSARGRSSIESGLRRDYENGGRRTARSRSRIDARAARVRPVSRFASLSRPAGAPLPRRPPCEGGEAVFRNNSVPRSSQMRNLRSHPTQRRDHYQERHCHVNWAGRRRR